MLIIKKLWFGFVGAILLVLAGWTVPPQALAQTDIPLPPGVWTDVTTAAGVKPGAPAIIQNNGPTPIRVLTSVNEPSNQMEGLSIIPGPQAFDARPINQARIWVFNPDPLKKGLLGFDSEMSISPMASDTPPKDFEVELAAGRIPGKSRVLKFGARQSLPGTTGVFAAIWNGPTDNYIPPTQARIHNLSSTSVADAGSLISSGTISTESLSKIIDISATFISDGVAVGDAVINDENCIIAILGVVSVDSETEISVIRMVSPATGLLVGPNQVGDTYRIVRAMGTGTALTFIQGLDSGRLKLKEFVINDGINPTPTINSYLRLFRMRSFKAGSQKKTVGTISAVAAVDLTVSAVINDGDNQTLMAIFTMAIDEIGYIKRWRAGLTRKQSATSTCNLRVGRLDDISYLSRISALVTAGTSAFEKKMTGFTLPGGIDIWIECDADSQNVGVAASFDIITEKIQ